METNELVIEGIVLKSVTYGENDAIISCLYKDGIIVFKARGVKKITSKNASSCLVYALSEFTLEKKGNNYFLLKGKLLSSNFKLYDDLSFMTCLGLVSESILNFLDNTNSMFESLQKMLEAINNGFDIFTLTAINLAKIIKESGYGLEVNQCVRCGSKKNISSISFFEGGFVCTNCLRSFEQNFSSEYLKTIRYIFNVDIDNYFHYQLDNKIAIDIIKKLMEYLKNQYDYKKLVFYELFDQTY